MGSQWWQCFYNGIVLCMSKNCTFYGMMWWVQMEVLMGWCKGDGNACFNPGSKNLVPYTGEEVEYFPIRSGGVADARSGTAACL